MRKSEPTLAALKAFEATVRRQSMTRAAGELATTQPAISQRIRSLETALGVALLDRSRRRARPTPSGQEFYDNIVGALDELQAATRQLKTHARRYRNEVRIGAHFGFAHQWLLPRLSALQIAFPSVRFEILPVDQNASDEMAGTDIRIIFTTLDSCGVADRLLMPEVVYPVCSPDFAARFALDKSMPANPAQQLPLLHMDQRDSRWLDWPRWLELAGLSRTAHPVRFQYRNYPLMLNAAMRGEGLALGWHGLVDDLIRNTSLIALTPRVQRPERGYVVGSSRTHNPVIRRVVDWLVDGGNRAA